MILFVVGKDRPGIVDDVSTILFEQNANIEDSRGAALGGGFGIMILFSCRENDLPKIEESLKSLHEMGFRTMLHEADDPAALPRQAEIPLAFEVTSMDHPGLVKKVVHILRGHGVSIDSLNTIVTTAPLSGTPLFNLSLEAGVPADQSITAVKSELSNLAADENFDLTFG